MEENVAGKWNEIFWFNTLEFIEVYGHSVYYVHVTR